MRSSAPSAYVGNGALVQVDTDGIGCVSEVKGEVWVVSCVGRKASSFDKHPRVRFHHHPRASGG